MIERKCGIYFDGYDRSVVVVSVPDSLCVVCVGGWMNALTSGCSLVWMKLKEFCTCKLLNASNAGVVSTKPHSPNSNACNNVEISRTLDESSLS